MDKDKAIQVIVAEVENCNATNDAIELIYNLIVDKGLDAKKIRNKVIKSEFNVLYRTDMKTMDIYGVLSCSYNLSEEAIQYIIRN